MFHLSQAIFIIFFYQIDCPTGQAGLVVKVEYMKFAMRSFPGTKTQWEIVLHRRV